MPAKAAIDFETEGTTAATILERRWFIAHQHAEALRNECEVLREVVQVAQANWREASARLASMQALCTALSEEFSSSSPEYFYSRK
jgi:hypothetical protein